MFVDASVLVAVLNKEPGWEELWRRLAETGDVCYVSSIVRYEAALAVARFRARASVGNVRPAREFFVSAREAVDELIAEIGAGEIEISGEIGDAAIDAAMTYGKVVGHPAKLNLGDCFAYACAKACGAGLIYKGNDFSQTDLA